MGVHPAEGELRPGLALLGRLAEQPERALLKPVLRALVALRGGLAVPLHGSGEVRPCAYPEIVHLPEHVEILRAGAGLFLTGAGVRAGATALPGIAAS